MASIGIGFLGEPAVAELIAPLIEGPVGHGVATAISVAIAFTLVTALHISIGEQVPKIIAITRPEGTARRTARPLHWFRRAQRPVHSRRLRRSRTRSSGCSASAT